MIKPSPTCQKCPMPMSCQSGKCCWFSGDDLTAYYLSGPMTGHPDYNKPAFHAMAKELRAAGIPTLNPAELDSADPAQMSWTDYLIRDLLALLTHCNAVAVLPGWQSSKGALLEVIVASFLGFNIHTAADLLAGDFSRPIGRWPIARALVVLYARRTAGRLFPSFRRAA